MVLSVACPACERRFQAPAQFQGKRVKCKACGEIFPIPAADDSANSEYFGAAADAGGDDALDQLAQSARSVVGVPNRASPDNISPVSAKLSPGAAGFAPNVLKFNYKGADDVDRWLPSTLIVVCALILGDVMTGNDTRDAFWLAITRFFTVALFYSMLIFPLTLMMIKKASREAKFSLPPQAQLRCFAVYMPALLLASWLFSQANGVFIIEVIGCFLGLAVSSLFLWLLFRLREPDIASFAVQGAGGFLGGTAASIVLILILNALTQMIVSDAKAQKSVPASPYAASLSWVSPPPPAVVAPAPTGRVPTIANVATAQPAPTTPIASAVPAKPVVKLPDGLIRSTSTLVDRVETNRIPGVIDGILDPLSDAPMIAVVRNTQGNTIIEPWNTTTWNQAHGAAQLPAGATKKFVLSADGQKLAWISEFPRLSVQIWSFPDARVSRTIPLDKAQGGAEMVGFVDNDRLLLERGNAKPVSAEAPVVVPGTVTVTAERENHSLFDGFKNNPEELAHEHATGIRPVPDPKPAPAPVAVVQDDSVPAHFMQIVDASTGTATCDFNLPALITDFVPSGSSANVFKSPLHLGSNIAVSTKVHRLVVAASTADSPALVQFDLTTGRKLAPIKVAEIDPSLAQSLAGLAYSNDGTRLATLFEHNEYVLLLTYDATTGAKLSDFTFPDGPLNGAAHATLDGGALIWLDPAPYLLVYGQGFIDCKTGEHLKSADLGLGTVLGQRALDGHRVEFLGIDNGARRVHVAELKPSGAEGDAKP